MRHIKVLVLRIRKFKSFILIFTLCYLTQAQISGRTFDGCGHPLAGAKILSLATQLSTTTDLDGNFSFSTTQTQFRPGLANNSCRFIGNKLIVNLNEPTFISIETFNLLGKKIGAGYKKWLLKGSYKFNALQDEMVSSSIYLLKIKIGQTAICFPFIGRSKRSFSGTSIVYAASTQNSSFAKAASSSHDTLIVSLDGYDTIWVPIESSKNLDTLTLNSYSYETKFYNGFYQVDKDSITITKRSLDTIQTYCGCYDSNGSGACYDSIVLRRDSIAVQTWTAKYYIIEDTLYLVCQTDTCFSYDPNVVDSPSPCIDTVHHAVDWCDMYTRTSQGSGVEGSWAHYRSGYFIAYGSIDSFSKALYDSNTVWDNSPWKIHNTMLIFDKGRYYERAFCQFTFAEGLIRDRQTCQPTIPINSNTGLQLDSCEWDISIAPINATTVWLHGNISGDSVLASRLPNNDIVLTSPLSGNIPALMKANPEVCPDTISWYLEFKNRNSQPWTYQAKKRAVNRLMDNRSRSIYH